MSSKSGKEVSRNYKDVLLDSIGKGVTGGLAGGAAQGINVVSLMWMRTVMNYQYRYGGGLKSTILKLYSDGGVPRFYRGLLPALMQAPLSRFGDTAANVGVLAFMEATDLTRNLSIGVKTAVASFAAASFRGLLMPLDAWKTTKQVEGSDGLRILLNKVRMHGIGKLWHGTFGAMGATWVGHYPWFFTHNYLSANLREFDFRNGKYVRNAIIGFSASVISDSISNSLRVIKTTKQTSQEPVSYAKAAKIVIEKDGYLGLLGRGLTTRILTNGAQGMIFSVAWKYIQEALDKRS